MASMVISSEHDLWREKVERGAPHRVHCNTCQVGAMTLQEAAKHAAKSLGTGKLFELFTLHGDHSAM